MRSGLALSATFHVIVLTIAYFGVPALFEPPLAIPAPIPVELVSIGDITTPKVEASPEPPKPQPKPEVKREPEPAEPPPRKNPPPRPQPIAKPELPSLPPPPLPKETEVAVLQPEPLPPPKPEPEAKKVEPPEPKPKAKPAPEPPKPKAKPAPKPVAKPVQKPRRHLARNPAPKPRARPRTKSKFDPKRIGALLDKTPRKAASPRQEEDKKRSVDDIEIQSRAQPFKLALAPTISELDFIRRQLLDCWYLPGGAKDLQNMRVTIRVELNSDGTLMRPPIVVDRIGRNTADLAFFRIFEESALRAVRACTDPEDPLQLPPGEAGKWRDLEFTFDPRDMLG